LCLTLFLALIFPLLTASGCGSGQGKMVVDPLPWTDAPPVALARAEVIGDWISRPTQILLPAPLPGGNGLYPGGTLQSMVLPLSVSSSGGMTGTLRAAPGPAAGGIPEGKLTGTCAEDGTFSARIEYMGTTTVVRGRFEIQGALVDLRMVQEGAEVGLFGGFYYLDRR